MKYCLPLSCVLLLICSRGLAANEPSGAPLVLLISVDGMKPEAVIDAQSHGLKVPNLRAFMADGIYAGGVRGVLPTLTYPSHTTLSTRRSIRCCAINGAGIGTPKTSRCRHCGTPLPRHTLRLPISIGR